MTHPYATRAYAEIAARPGETVLAVPEWGTHVVRRPVAGLDDAAGCYPLTVFDGDVDLQAGRARMKDLGLVSAVLVADPVLRPDDARLRRAFDLCRPFKTHYLYDRALGDPVYSRHHRYELRRARADIACIALGAYLDDWISLYRGLIVRRGISGPAAFSEESFRRLANFDGLVAFGAFAAGAMVACHLWVRSGPVVHSHLSASNARGRACGAAYLLYDAAVRHFDDAGTIDFGGGVGLSDDPGDGLARFKRGFANRMAPAWLCGAILNSRDYNRLCKSFVISEEENFFPAYRAPGAGFPKGAQA